MTPSPSPYPSDAGETLVEILISVAIMGIVMVGLIAGLTSATIAGDAHRRLTDVEVVARTYGEAVVSSAAHPAATTLTVAAASGSSSVTVASNSSFPANASASVDGEVVLVQSKTGTTTLNLANPLTDGHAAGSPVMRYESCPGPAFFPSGSASGLLSAPAITLIEYLAQPASAGATPTVVASWDGSGSPPALCSSYWTNTGLPCSADEAPRPHYTVCDLPLLRLTIKLDSTDVARASRGATTTTQVLINRGNA